MRDRKKKMRKESADKICQLKEEVEGLITEAKDSRRKLGTRTGSKT
ncbi:hypothetical protein PI124_g21692 [Phytophthora idaei]|nr:hypothetical protein PI125_g25447 [Phytophthora idaei]KAG3124222.1 hypothetical protein PI126_g23348 [Phytophthora idaei]KAG3233230.1 hypothetical protein PI124_g21692 [Phytophthora idaei]